MLEEAPVIEHTVSMGGNVEDSFFTDGLNDPAYFQIDGMKAPQLVVRRGEIHRFYFRFFSCRNHHVLLRHSEKYHSEGRNQYAFRS